jgi:glycine oxidase
VSTHSDVIIIGGGIIGCSLALNLAQSGLKVSVFDQSRIGEEASWAAAGMLAPQTDASERSAFFDLCMSSRSIYQSFASHLQEISGIDPQYQDQGILFVTLDQDEAADLGKWCSWQTQSGLNLTQVSGDGARDLEPSVSVRATAGVVIPGDHQIDNRRLMHALATSIKRLGVDVNECAPVEQIAIREGRATGIRSNGQTVEAGIVVMAAGCWSGDLLKEAGMIVPVVPARGQMIALKSEGLPFSRVIHGTHCYLVPRRDHRIIVGSTMEYVGFQKGITVAGIASLLLSAIDLVPALNTFEIVETWSGLRPDTTDHLPVLGPCEIDNLYLATGHFRNGILLAPITAQLIADCIITGKVSDQVRPFGADRFGKPG